MKKILFFCAVLSLTVLATSCGKERECRCAVKGKSDIRIIRIQKGTCQDIYSYLWDQDPVLYPDIMDSILCTDFDFEPYMD